MKNLTFLLVSLLSYSILYSQDIGGDYYVSPTGSTISGGTYLNPFKHIQQAINVAKPGDTIYIRGGVYDYYSAEGNNIHYIHPAQGVGRSGTKDKPICYFNYPGEIPILDCSNIVSPGGYNTGFNILHAEYLKFRGIEIKNLFQRGSSDFGNNISVVGINAYECANMTFRKN